MLVKAQGRFLRISPTKVRQVIDLIRGEDVNTALAILAALNKRPKVYIEKILRSAIENAKRRGISIEKLYISKITANGGPMLKRYRAAAFGRAVMIRRRTSHIRIELDLKSV